MRRLFCLLAVALLAAAPAYGRQLKFDFPAASPAASPSKPDSPTDACVSSYNAVMDNDTGACRDGAKVTDCCEALAGLGKTCLTSVYDYMKDTPESNAKAFAFLESLLEQCTSPTPSPKPSDQPSQQCIDDFNAMVDSGACSKGASASKCCAALSAVGSSCLDAIEAAMEQEPEKYANTLSALKSTRKECGGTGPNPTPQEPTEQCVADFNAAMKSPCGKGSTASQCCSALKGLGSCLDDIMAAMAAQKDKYADDLKTLEGMVEQCGSGPSPKPSPNVDEKCLNGLMATFDNGPCAGSSATACCDSLDKLGKDCLESFLAYTKQDNITVHDAFVDLLQSCGWTITTSNSGTRAAAEVTTQAMTTLQAIGAAKLAAAPQAARRALTETALSKLEKPVAKVQHSAHSSKVVV
jgi:hypothetical protein